MRYGILDGPPLGKAPDVLAETPELLPDLYKGLGIGYGRFDLEAVADNPRICEQLLDLVLVVSGDLVEVKPVKYLPEMRALLKHGNPAQTGLEGFQDQEFKKGWVVLHGHSPFRVVIRFVEGVAQAPATPVFFHTAKVGQKMPADA